MKNWRQFVADRTIHTEEYYITVPTQYDLFSFRIRYVKHNGYTLILPIDHEHENLSVFGAMFIDWFKWHQQYNTRFDKPGWWKPIRFNRRKKLVQWALKSVDQAYTDFKAEMVDKTINE